MFFPAQPCPSGERMPFSISNLQVRKLKLSVPIPSSFQKYEFTDKELEEGYKLSPIAIQILQNEAAVVMEQRAALDYDINNPQTFIQQEAFFKGQLSILEMLINHNLGE